MKTYSATKNLYGIAAYLTATHIPFLYNGTEIEFAVSEEELAALKAATGTLEFRLQQKRGNVVTRIVSVVQMPCTHPVDAEHEPSRQILPRPRLRYSTHTHHLEPDGKGRLVCRDCGRSFPLTPEGDLDVDRVLEESLLELQMCRL